MPQVPDLNETTENSPVLTEAQRIEYGEANDWWRTLSQMRRRDIALFTGGQGAVLAIIGGELLNFGPEDWALSLVAFLIAIVGLNNERRLYAYLKAFRNRAERIEADHGMHLVSNAQRALSNLNRSVSSSSAFQLYYGIIAASWVLLWMANI